MQGHELWDFERKSRLRNSSSFPCARHVDTDGAKIWENKSKPVLLKFISTGLGSKIINQFVIYFKYKLE